MLTSLYIITQELWEMTLPLILGLLITLTPIATCIVAEDLTDRIANSLPPTPAAEPPPNSNFPEYN